MSVRHSYLNFIVKRNSNQESLKSTLTEQINTIIKTKGKKWNTNIFKNSNNEYVINEVKAKGNPNEGNCSYILFNYKAVAKTTKVPPLNLELLNANQKPRLSVPAEVKLKKFHSNL